MMSLITQSALLTIADRCAWQSKQIMDGIDAILNDSSGHSYAATVTATDDYDVEIPLLSTYYNSDNGFNKNSTLRSQTALTNIVTGMDTHFARVNFTGSWDGFLTDNSIQVGSYFDLVVNAAKSSHLLANNVFCETSVTFASIEITGGSTLVFTDGQDFGNGAAANKAATVSGSSVYYAPTQLQIYVQAGGNVAADVSIEITGKDAANEVKTLTHTVAGALTPGQHEDIGTGADLWLDITNVTRLAGADSDFIITNLPLRTPAP